MDVLDTGLIPVDEGEPAFETWAFRIELAGEAVRIGREWFRGTRSHELPVPAGELTLQLWPYGSEDSQTRVIQLRPGQRKVVTFAFD